MGIARDARTTTAARKARNEDAHSDPYLVDGFRITRQRDEHIAQEMGETSLPKAL
jgi:hypothetical protein